MRNKLEPCSWKRERARLGRGEMRPRGSRLRAASGFRHPTSAFCLLPSAFKVVGRVTRSAIALATADPCAPLMPARRRRARSDAPYLKALFVTRPNNVKIKPWATTASKWITVYQSITKLIKVDKGGRGSNVHSLQLAAGPVARVHFDTASVWSSAFGRFGLIITLCRVNAELRTQRQVASGAVSRCAPLALPREITMTFPTRMLKCRPA
jgi:hypothetical protein